MTTAHITILHNCHNSISRSSVMVIITCNNLNNTARINGRTSANYKKLPYLAYNVYLGQISNATNLQQTCSGLHDIKT